MLDCGAGEETEDEMRAATARMRNAEHVLVPRYGHLQAFWHADVTGGVVDGWLSRLGLQRSRRTLHRGASR